MSRPAATIVVVGHQAAPEPIAAGLAQKDRVATVPPGDDEALLRAVVDATTPVVVVVDRPGLATRGHWLDELLSVFRDESVALAGPCSDLLRGPQRVQLDRPVSSREDLRLLVRQRATRFHGRLRDAATLSAACFAVRVEAVHTVDPARLTVQDELDPDLVASLVREGYRVGVADGSYLHPGIAPEGEGPLLSAALIVKDEEDNLPRCLASLAGVVDEIVVHDTGSTDRTVEIAQAAGARVIRGWWDDDFSRARNVAVDACTGRWVLAVDADEEVVADVPSLRGELDQRIDVDGYPILIENLDGRGVVKSRHHHARLFVRQRAHFSGRLHEQVVERPLHPTVRFGKTSALHLVHHGYMDEVVADRGKLERNVRLAEREVEETSGVERAVALTNLVRTLASLDRDQEALARAREAHAIDAPARPRVMLLRAGCETMLKAGVVGEAITWAQELRELGEARLADFFEGWASLMSGDYDRAAELLDDTSPAFDASGQELASIDVVVRRALAHLALGRAEQALPDLEAVLVERPDAQLWNPVAQAAWHAGVPMDRVAALLPEEQIRAAAAQVAVGNAQVADAFAEALWSRFEGDPRVLALGALVAPRTSTARALEWSARVRALDLPDRCPLLVRARATGLDPLERLTAAAVAHGTFGDETAARLAPEAAAIVGDDGLVDAVTLVSELAPDLLADTVVALATTPARCDTLAAILREGGAPNEADAVAAWGSSLALR